MQLNELRTIEIDRRTQTPISRVGPRSRRVGSAFTLPAHWWASWRDCDSILTRYLSAKKRWKVWIGKNVCLHKRDTVVVCGCELSESGPKSNASGCQTD